MSNKNLQQIKEAIFKDINDEVLVKILFDINRYFDKEFTKATKKEQQKNNRVFNSIERKILRNYFYHGNIEDLMSVNIKFFPVISYSEEDIDKVCIDISNRINHYDSSKIINSIIKRYENLINHKQSSISFKNEWLDYYNRKRNNLFSYSSFILRINNLDFQKHNYDEAYIYNLIANAYSQLENYRHLIVVIDGQIYNKFQLDITWQIIYKICLYSEGFINYEEEFFACKKDQQIETLQNFIKQKFETENNNIAQDFYRNISTGFKYEDCLIEDNQNTIILTFKKISRDESPVPCPSCMTTIQSGNSYPEMFLRSYECKNPHCPDRSKSGRGKRFDEYGVYRNFKLEENNTNNIINNQMYTAWRRDIFHSNTNWLEMIIKYYTWNNETILTYNLDATTQSLFNRNLVNNHIFKTNINYNYAIDFENLEIVKLFKKIKNLINYTNGNKKLKSQLEIIHGDSSKKIPELQQNQIGTAITSPPYYNAREYSQWENLILYLIDMLINASAIFNTLNTNGNYLYNIGDVVGEDNIYVKSHMSNRRLPLGFLSCMIFEIAGFNLAENIIWDKGEVQSKRNSTVNLFSGYIKCINCYEHIFVFTKKKEWINSKTIATINPVIKINSKGENTYKHTAPYPIDLVDLVKPYLQNDKYLLDPFLGSGTTLKWCKLNNVLGVGYELNKTYYELAQEKINKEKED